MFQDLDKGQSRVANREPGRVHPPPGRREDIMSRVGASQVEILTLHLLGALSWASDLTSLKHAFLVVIII